MKRNNWISVLLLIFFNGEGKILYFEYWNTKYSLFTFFLLADGCRFFCHKILKKPSSNRQKLSYSVQAKESTHKQTKMLISLEYQVHMDRSNNDMSIFIVLVL